MMNELNVKKGYSNLHMTKMKINLIRNLMGLAFAWSVSLYSISEYDI